MADCRMTPDTTTDPSKLAKDSALRRELESKPPSLLNLYSPVAIPNEQPFRISVISGALPKDTCVPPEMHRRMRNLDHHGKNAVYWEKRRRNNESVRRSRERKRREELAMEWKLRELFEQNQMLQTQLNELRKRETAAQMLSDPEVTAGIPVEIGKPDLMPTLISHPQVVLADEFRINQEPGSLETCQKPVVAAMVPAGGLLTQLPFYSNDLLTLLQQGLLNEAKLQEEGQSVSQMSPDSSTVDHFAGPKMNDFDSNQLEIKAEEKGLCSRFATEPSVDEECRPRLNLDNYDGEANRAGISDNIWINTATGEENSLQHCLRSLEVPVEKDPVARGTVILHNATNDQRPSLLESEYTKDTHDIYSNASSSQDNLPYRERRRRNNEAVRRCRAKEKALNAFKSKRTEFLERENRHLRNTVDSLQQELRELKEVLRNVKGVQDTVNAKISL